MEIFNEYIYVLILKMGYIYNKQLTKKGVRVMKHQMFRYLGLLTVTGAVALADVAPAKAITIDDFDQQDQFVQDNTADDIAASSTTTNPITSGVGNLNRTITVNAKNDTSISPDNSINARVAASTDEINFINTDGDIAGDYFITYESASGTPFNLLQGGNPNNLGTSLLLRRSDQDTRVRLTLNTVSGNDTSAFKDLPRNQAGGETVVFPFNTFDNSLTFDEVNSLQFEFDVAEATDFSVDEIQVIPFEAEAATGIAVLGLWGVWKLRRRQNKPSVN